MTTSPTLTGWISERIDEHWDEIVRNSVEHAYRFDGHMLYRSNGRPELWYDADSDGEGWAAYYAELCAVDPATLADVLAAATPDDMTRAYVETITGDGLANGDTPLEAFLWQLLADGFRTGCDTHFDACYNDDDY